MDEQELWKQFAEATNIRAFCQSWLSLQCHMVKGGRCALVLLGPPDQGPFTPAAVWPNVDFSVKHLTSVAEQSLRERRGLLVRSDSSSPAADEQVQTYQIAYPIEISGKMHGVVVLEIFPQAADEIQGIMRQLHWGVAWLEVMLRRAEAKKAGEINERLRMALDLLVSVVEQERFQQAAMALVTQLAMKLGCDRVSIGFASGGHMRVKALSHSAEFGKQMNLVRAIEAAMDEAVDQQATIIFPLPENAPLLVTRAHAALSRQHGSGVICTIPIRSDGHFIAGLTLERPEEQVFDAETIELCETVAALAGPILNTKRREERWLITKAAESLQRQLKNLFGPGHLLLKILSTLLLAAVIFFAYTEGEYRITSPVTLEGTIQRAICAPFNGYIAEARARAGDVVKEGELLCLLDDRDLKLEYLKWVTQKEQLLKQYHEAMAKRDRPQMQITHAKIQQAEAQISLIHEQLLRTKVVAPFWGVIIKGDLSQSLGAPVERGQVLFEMAPLESYRVIVQVDERDIADVAVDQRGEIMMPSMPGVTFPFRVEKITPVAVAKEGRNYFRVEARLDDISERLRPGMEGVGKIKVEKRLLIWIWTHELFDWLRLWVWTWWP